MNSAEFIKSNQVQHMFRKNVMPIHENYGNVISYKICQPVIIFGKLLGLLSWDMTLKNLNKPKRSLCGHAFSILYKIFFALVMVLMRVRHLMLIADKDEDNKYAEMSVAVNFSRRHVQFVFAGLVFVFCFWEEKRFWNMMKLFGCINDLVYKKVKGGKFLFKHLTFHTSLSLITVTLQIIAAAIKPTYNTEMAIYYSITVVLMVTAYGYFVTMYFVITANLCGQSFTVLNTELRELLSSNASISYRLRQIRFRYTQLYELASSIRDTFAWLISAALALNSAFLCLSAYVLLYRNYDNSLTDYVAVVTLFICVSRILYISSASDNIATMARLSLECLQNTQRQNLTRREEFQVMLLINKLAASPIEISAAFGLFTVNMKTFTTIVSTILTYLVVLTQFRGSYCGETKPDKPYELDSNSKVNSSSPESTSSS